jgi:hypothetical protein
LHAPILPPSRRVFQPADRRRGWRWPQVRGRTEKPGKPRQLIRVPSVINPMTYQRNRRYWIQATKVSGNSITFCSCVLDGTQVERNPARRELTVMWIKDAAAGAGLLLFMVSAFVLASGAQALIVHPTL